MRGRAALVVACVLGGCATGASHEADGGPDMSAHDAGTHDGGPDAMPPADARPADLDTHDLGVDSPPPPVDLGADAPPPVDLGVDGGCPFMLTRCGTLCVDTTVNTADCGTCGHACAVGESCIASTCTPPTATWSTNATSHMCPADVGMRFDYVCPAGGSASSLWGTGEYTNDSSICTAAVHSGHITLASGGRVTIEMRAGRASYTASTQHGVTSSSYGAWGCSYAVVAPACPASAMSCTPDVCTDLTSDSSNCGTCGMACTAPRVCSASACACPPGQTDCGGTCVDTTSDRNHCGSCTMVCGAGLACTASACGGTPATWSTSATTHSCPADVGSTFVYTCPPGGAAGGVWGTDTYTHDSSICTAAVHVGRITLASGGDVTIQMAAGLSSYVGSTRNGITTMSYGAWSCSYTFP